MKLETMLNHFAEDRSGHQGAVVPPIYQNSLFTFESLGEIEVAFEDPANRAIYTRGNNPSVALVEAKIARLCRGERAKLFGSGMAAISSAIMHCVQANDHIVTIRNLYGPTNNFINSYLRRKMSITATFVPGKDPADFENAIRPETRLIYLESPSSLLFSVQDLESVASIARDHGLTTIVDNTWASPIFQTPLDLGIDLEVHSCSKYLGGHSDIVAGVVIGKTEVIERILLEEHALFGGKMAPFEAWLLMRSLRTLPIRMKKHQENSRRVAHCLEEHPAVARVFYPGAPSFEQRRLADKQLTGFSGLMSFELTTKSQKNVEAFVDGLEFFQIGVSWGGHESLVFPPGLAYEKELPPDQFEAMGISRSLIRISVGLEDAEDLVADLEKSLSRL